jgi:hypothetical protein
VTRIAGFQPIHSRPKRPAEPTVLFVGLLVAYVSLLSLASIAQSGLLKGLANVFAVMLFVVLLVRMVSGPPVRLPPAGLAIGLALYWLGLVCSAVVNRDVLSYGDLLKLLLAPGFLLIGAAFESQRASVLWHRRDVRLLFAALVVLPLLAWGVQLVRNGFVFGGIGEAGMFSNRNNAGLYAVTLLGLYAILAERPVRSVLPFLVVGVMFGTLGVLLSVVVALMLTVARAREMAVLAAVLAVGAVGYHLVPEVPPYDRIVPVVQSIRYLIDGRINLYTVTFADLVVLLRTSDVSFMFRLMHWADLWQVFSASDPYHWLFGHGVDSSVPLSRMKLVPHSDYVRYLFEFGVVAFIGFVTILVTMLARCGRRWETVPILVVVVYFFSENLVTNYTAMALFFFAAGALATRRHAPVVPSSMARS